MPNKAVKESLAAAMNGGSSPTADGRLMAEGLNNTDIIAVRSIGAGEVDVEQQPADQ